MFIWDSKQHLTMGGTRSNTSQWMPSSACAASAHNLLKHAHVSMCASPAAVPLKCPKSPQQAVLLVGFVVAMLPAFLPVFFFYLRSKRILKNITYGPSIRHWTQKTHPALNPHPRH